MVLTRNVFLLLIVVDYGRTRSHMAAEDGMSLLSANSLEIPPRLSLIYGVFSTPLFSPQPLCLSISSLLPSFQNLFSLFYNLFHSSFHRFYFSVLFVF